jgi:exosome complex exonuclease DIS3/RRP44
MFASSKASVRITKRPTKHVVKTVVQEHYLRDDIGCGSSLCSFCLQDNAPLSNKKPVTYLILDTNVILHQIDLLLKPILKNIIILATVRSEVQNRSYQSYVKLQKILADEDRRCYVFVNEHSRFVSAAFH